MLLLELLAKGLLDCALGLGDRKPGNRNRARLRQFDLTLPIDRSAKPRRLTAPHVDDKVVSWPENIVRADWQVYGQLIYISGSKEKSVASEAS
ncbi:MAG: hypothetical protein WBX18_08395 [Terracidiphilus sp.]